MEHKLEKLKEIIVNIESGEVSERIYTAAEVKAAKDLQARLDAENEAMQIELDAKAATRNAVLAKLGLTADEAAALLG